METNPSNLSAVWFHVQEKQIYRIYFTFELEQPVNWQRADRK